MPFHVGVNNMNVEVLGTHFNINAYNDEKAIKTTLLEGSVKVASPNPSKGGALNAVVIRPGQQAVLTSDKQLSVNNDVNTDHVIAWKEGLFDFDNEELPDIMRQLSRWYDIDINYPGGIPAGHYSGGIRRQTNISEVLKMIETAGGVEFNIDGKKIFVRSK
jgi:ferric-dicitrate binding protein FerR (iron transport regulator)